MKFYIETIGCKVNLYESEFVKQSLLKEGFFQCGKNEKADVIILNTCSVTNTSDSKCLKIARRLKRENEKALFVVCGCSTQNDKKAYELMDIDIILGNKDKALIPKLIKNLKKDTKSINISDPNKFEFENMYIDTFAQTRAYIKIQDGCENFCSYCVIPYVRGRVRFKEYNKVIKEAEGLALNNYKEIVLTGIHTGSYPNLPNLINDISKISGIKRIRISSIEITELKEEFMNVLKDNKVLCDHLHIPLQAGSDSILKRMNRKYDTKTYEAIINKIRNIRPGINISTDVIVGHPYETDLNFEETINFCKKIKFSKIHVFPYSDRNGTLASKMEEHVNPTVIKDRSKKLIEVSEILEKDYIRKFYDEKHDVLIEDIKDSYSIGHTSNFLKIKCDKSFKRNEFYEIKLTKENCLKN